MFRSDDMMPGSALRDDGEPALHSLPEHQCAAVASPQTPSTHLVGSFTDLASLFDRLGEPNVMELGKPLRAEKYLPKGRLGGCPAAHNAALLDEVRPTPFRTNGARKAHR
jgi:hypothetical protein